MKIPDGVDEIGVVAIYKCLSLTDVIIPDGVTFIGRNAFEDVLSVVYKGKTYNQSRKPQPFGCAGFFFLALRFYLNRKIMKKCPIYI